MGTQYMRRRWHAQKESQCIARGLLICSVIEVITESIFEKAWLGEL